MDASSFLLALSVIFIVLPVVGAGYSAGGARAAFERSFDESCSKYPFVRKHVDLLDTTHNPKNDRYMIYSFAEHGMGSNGGLGDRLAGLVTAVAYAARTGRRFLITADAAFQEMFVPYHPSHRSSKISYLKDKNTTYHWKDWGWSGYKDEFSSDMSFISGCVNPKSTNIGCALDGIDYKHKVIKHRGNRCYLCRWAMRPGLNLEKELYDTLGISKGGDLYEVAGCLLRLVMWPSELMWDNLDKWTANQGMPDIPIATNRLQEAKLVSVHFRCGDASFAASGDDQKDQCLFDITGKRKWKGTSFADDYSLESPVDCAQCAHEKMNLFRGNKKQVVVMYIASDNAATARQINSTTSSSLHLVPQKACHADHSHHGGAHLCAVDTFVQWFLLSLSDVMVVQSLRHVDNPSFSIYQEYSDATKETEEVFSMYEKGGPISAFSRFAGIYGLRSESMVYGLQCQTANRSALSWQTRGNWMCDNKLFY
jgi:hypothetical protein